MADANGEPDRIYPELFRCHGLAVRPLFELGEVQVHTAMGGHEMIINLDAFQTRDLYNALRPLVEGYAPIGPAED